MGEASRDATGRLRDGTVRAESALVGRGREQGEIALALDEALTGRGRLLLLVGEPGIGKTRLADEASRLAARRSVPVLWGRAWEAGGAPPYWPWLDLLANLVDRLDDQAVRDCVGEGEPLLAALIPALRSRLGPAALPASEPPSPEVARFRCWRAVGALIRRAAAPAGLLLVQDDLHSADEASLALLQFVAREVRSTRLLLIATYRDVEARLAPGAGELIGRISREGSTLALRPLDREAAATLLGQRMPALEPTVLSRIFESTQGNPLFLEEMVRLVGEQGAPAVVAGVLPEGVREVIRQRLLRVLPEAKSLLDLAAVAGDEIDVALLSAASARPITAITDDLRAATRAGLLSLGEGRRRFSHDLVREVLYADLPALERQALHGRVVRALERLRGDDPVPPLAELAHHGFAGPAAGLAQAVDHAVLAAQRSLRLAAYDEAVAMLERAARAVEAVGNPNPLRARVMLALADAHIRRGETALGQTLCRQVAMLARAHGDPALLARAALTHGLVFTFAVVDPVLVEMLEESLAALPGEDSLLRVQLLARLGGALQPARNSEEPVRVARAGIEMARRLGDRPTLLGALVSGISALMDVAPARERLGLNLEAADLARALGDRERLARTLSRLPLDHLEMGELAAADAAIAAFEAVADELRAPWYLWRARLLRAMRLLMHGRFAEAEALADLALRLGQEAGDHQVERCVTLHREGQRRVRERHEEMRAQVAQSRQHWGSYGVLGIGWQWMTTAQVFARLEDAEETRRALDLVPTDMMPPVDNVYGLFYAAEPVAFVGAPELAERIYRMLLPAADRCVVLGMTQLLWEGPVQRLLALLAARFSAWAEAERHFEEALAWVQRLDARPYRARVAYEYGRALSERGAPGDQARAAELFSRARVGAEALGLTGLIRLIDGRLAPSLVTASPPAPPVGAPLAMAREGEYFTFAYEGETVRLKDSLGLRYLERLLAHPGEEIHVLELAGGREAAGDEGAAGADAGDAGELLDAEARERYRRRLEELREELALAEAAADAPRAARAEEEIAFLGTELRRAVGLGGRSRRAGAAAERARSAVQRRIRNAIDRIGEHAPALARYLEQAVRTGTFCAFRPVPARSPAGARPRSG